MGSKAMKDFFTLVPHSGIQFVTEQFDLATTPRFSRIFYERHATDSANPSLVIATLHPGWHQFDPEGDPLRSEPGDLELSISKQKALEPFIDKWVPVPYLRFVGIGQNREESYERGPTNWVRVKVSKKAARKEGSEPYSVVFAFDTEVLKRMDNRPYTAPSIDDALSGNEFRFVADFNSNAWFVSNPEADPITRDVYDWQSWVLKWLQELFREMKETQRPGRPFREDDLEYRLEYAARYFAFLEFLKIAVDPARIHFVNTVATEQSSPSVGVDLILDIGNSRTCGLLIERFPNEHGVELSNSMVLELRDLERPDQTYDKPFESHVELISASFGKEDLSRESGRSKAFFWPGVVRVGPEAARYREQSDGTHAISGMSSPKRYLWDVAASNQDWQYNAALGRTTSANSPIERAMLRFTNKQGDVLSQVKADMRFFTRKLLSPRDVADVDKTSSRTAYSRSSFFAFMVAEIVWQAMAMVNNPQVRARRGQKDLPRQIERIFFTMPTAMPIREQRIMKMRAESAVKLIWDLMGWSAATPPNLVQPKVLLNLDEASCVQFVYLYSEVARKYGGNISQYFTLGGRPRPYSDIDQKPKSQAQSQPSLRIASIDIGGGTTDLMITTYYSQHDRAILPVQVFREGFRIAGDDILRAVIEHHVLPGIEEGLVAAGMRNARQFLKEKFEGDRGGLAARERHLRRQFALRVLSPIGLAILRTYEKAGIGEQFSVKSLSLAELLENGEQTASLGSRVSSYIEEGARERGATEFSLSKCNFSVDFPRLAETINAVLQEPFKLFTEVIHHFDCDVVLLTGRPSCLPCVAQIMKNLFPTEPDRVLSLHSYQPGPWYPFSGRGDGRIADPKTTASVGCLLGALSERQLTNFKLETSGLRMRSTAGFIGVLGLDFKLSNDNVIFRNDDRIRPGEIAEQRISFYGNTRVGFRQMPFERWAGTPLYMLKLEVGNYDNVRMPIEVTLEREVPEEINRDERNFLDRFQESEAQKEELRVREAVDADGNSLTRSVTLSLNTLIDDGGYWLDTGVLNIS